MAAPRLLFLWPFLLAPAKSAARPPASRSVNRGFRTAARKRQEAVNQRYGTANEPPPHLTGLKNIQNQAAKDVSATKEVKAPAKAGGRIRKEKAAKEQPAEQQAAVEPQAPKEPQRPTKDGSQAPVASAAQMQAALLEPTKKGPTASADTPPKIPAPPSPSIPSRKPMETVLNMPSSDDLEVARVPMHYHENASTNPDEHRPPHIATPPYVHHFDTYGLVKRLETGGWTQAQAVTTMKAVRLILAENMDLAREGLVSKSNVENETYLFRAACSELRTEINTRRKGETDKSRTERAQLQHEVDILGQRLTQEGGILKDDLKGMFDDRKMAVRNEQRSMESKIQELNYRITVTLNSDSRSDVEGVRWIITKRAIAALFTCVLMVLGSLKYTSIMMQMQEEERRRFAALGASEGGSGSGGGSRTSREEQEKKRQAEAMGAGEMLVQEGDNPAFVSLG